jgi:hypothetical protein
VWVLAIFLVLSVLSVLASAGADKKAAGTKNYQFSTD